MKLNFWEDNLKEGNKAEALVLKQLQQQLSHYLLTKISFEEFPEIQREGIDGILKKQELKVEIKVRENWTHKYKDILIEENHSYGKLGWWHTTKSDIVIYVWWNENKTEIIDGYLIIMSNELKKWFEEIKDNYPKKIAKTMTNNNHYWETTNIAIPISNWPEQSLIKINNRGLK